MKFEIRPSHVAVLVPSVRKAADYLKKFEFQIGPEETFEGEGTKEIYVEYGQGNSLLLVQPNGPGPYKQALEKRGPGLHHLAIDVLDLEDFIESLAGSGWLLHPKSIKMMKTLETVYLARPGFPGLIEVQQKKELGDKPNFVTEIGINVSIDSTKLLSAVGLSQIVKLNAKSTSFTMRGHVIQLEDLIGD